MIVGLPFLSLAVACEGEPESSSGATGSDSAVVVQGEKGSSAREPLTAMQKKRLGPAVRRLLTGDTLSRPSDVRKAEPAGQRQGEDVYSVLIEGADVETLQEAGVPVTSTAGGVITARLTTDQIRQVASIQEVRRIRFPKRARSQ